MPREIVLYAHILAWNADLLPVLLDSYAKQLYVFDRNGLGGWSVTVKVFVHILGTYIDCAAIMNKWGKSIPAGN